MKEKNQAPDVINFYMGVEYKEFPIISDTPMNTKILERNLLAMFQWMSYLAKWNTKVIGLPG